MNIEKLFYKFDNLENEFNNNKNNSKIMSRVLLEFRTIHGSLMIGLQQKLKKCLDNTNDNQQVLINISIFSSLVNDIQQKINNLENVLDCFLDKNCKNQNELNKLFKVKYNYKEYENIFKGITLFDTENDNFTENNDKDDEDEDDEDDEDENEIVDKINKMMDNNYTKNNNTQNNKDTKYFNFVNNEKELNKNNDTLFMKNFVNNNQFVDNSELSTEFDNELNGKLSKYRQNNNNKDNKNNIKYKKLNNELNFNEKFEKFEENFEQYEEGYEKQGNELNNFGDKNVNNNNQTVERQRNVINNNTNSNNNTFLYFYMPNCPHCENFVQTWNDIKSDKTYKNVNFIKLNINEKGKKGDKIRELMELYNVDSFPTLILLNNNKVQHYPGSRTLHGIRNFINRNI